MRSFSCFLLLLLLVLASCSRFQQLRKSSLWQEKYKGAKDYYQAGKYAKASLLLESILPLIRGASEGEEGLFMYAYAQYYQEQYILSAEYFKIFAKTYPRSPKAEEASYMHAYSQYLNTGPYYLDPNPTYEALDALQAFLETYPQSKDRAKAQDILEKLQAKLAKKAFENAKQYYLLGYYKASAIVFKDFQNTFSDSELIEESESIRIQAQYEWASQSVAEKQYKRYQNVQASYEAFLENYPKSRYIDQLRPLYDRSLGAMSNILQQHRDATANP